MDWKLLFSTAATLFVAELGDKTQFAAMAASSQTKNTGTLLLGVLLGLGLAGTMGVVAGRLLGEFLNPNTLRWISGGLFIAVGIWTWVKG